MVIVLVTGRVPPEKEDELREAYEREAADLPPHVLRTVLVRDVLDEERWSIATMRSDDDVWCEAGEEPRGVELFRSVDVEPTTSVYRVVSSAHRRLGLAAPRLIDA